MARRVPQPESEAASVEFARRARKARKRVFREYFRQRGAGAYVTAAERRVMRELDRRLAANRGDLKARAEARIRAAEELDRLGTVELAPIQLPE